MSETFPKPLTLSPAEICEMATWSAEERRRFEALAAYKEFLEKAPLAVAEAAAFEAVVLRRRAQAERGRGKGAVR